MLHLPKRLGWLALFLMACGTVSTEAQTLRWKFATGDQFDLKFDQLTQSDSVVLERNVSITSRIKMLVEWKVTAVDEKGNAEISQEIKSVSMKLTNTNPDGGQRTISVDSEIEPAGKVEEGILKDVKPLLNAKITFKLSPLGAASEFKIPEATMEAIRQASSSMEIRKILTEQGIKNVFGPSSFQLPEKEIKKDDHWQSSRVFQNDIGNFKQTFDYKVVSTDNVEAIKIGVVSKAELDKKKKSKVEVKSQSGEGQIVFDQTAGNLTKSFFKTSVETVTPYREMKINVKTRDEVMLEIARK